MRDRTASRNYSAEREDFRRRHKRHRDGGLAQRHAERLRRLRAGRAAAGAVEASEASSIAAIEQRSPSAVAAGVGDPPPRRVTQTGCEKSLLVIDEGGKASRPVAETEMVGTAPCRAAVTNADREASSRPTATGVGDGPASRARWVGSLASRRAFGAGVGDGSSSRARRVGSLASRRMPLTGAGHEAVPASGVGGRASMLVSVASGDDDANCQAGRAGVGVVRGCRFEYGRSGAAPSLCGCMSTIERHVPPPGRARVGPGRMTAARPQRAHLPTRCHGAVLRLRVHGRRPRPITGPDAWRCRAHWFPFSQTTRPSLSSSSSCMRKGVVMRILAEENRHGRNGGHAATGWSEPAGR